MVTLAFDLTAQARIRNAALEGFAQRGFAATSTREIARSAGVSLGLVQHHYPTKDGLRVAVDDYVREVAEAAFSGLPEATTLTESLEQLGQRVSHFVIEEPHALLYVARAALQGEDAGLRSFDAFVAIADAQWRRLADDGLLDGEVDLPWAALHVTIINLGTVLFADAVSRHLPESFSAPEQVDRWREATVALFDRGLSRRGSTAPSPQAPPAGIPDPAEASSSHVEESEDERP